MEVKHLGNVRVLAFPEKLDDQTAPTIREILMELLQSGARKILCDFSRTTAVSQAGLKILLGVLHRLHQEGGQMAFSLMRPDVRQMFDAAGLTQIFRFYDTDEALQVVILRELATHFQLYNDIHGILLQRQEGMLTAELYLEFDGALLMRQVQRQIDTLQTSLTAKLDVSRVLIIPTLKPPLAAAMQSVKKETIKR